MILPDERQEDYDKIQAGWRAEFEPEGYQEERLLEILIMNDWLLRRAQRRLMEADASGDEREMERRDRRKTRAEAAFYRAWNALQGLRKDIMRRELALIRSHAKVAQLEALMKETEPNQTPVAQTVLPSAALQARAGQTTEPDGPPQQALSGEKLKSQALQSFSNRADKDKIAFRTGRSNKDIFVPHRDHAASP